MDSLTDYLKTKFDEMHPNLQVSPKLPPIPSEEVSPVLPEEHTLPNVVDNIIERQTENETPPSVQPIEPSDSVHTEPEEPPSISSNKDEKESSEEAKEILSISNEQVHTAEVTMSPVQPEQQNPIPESMHLHQPEDDVQKGSIYSQPDTNNNPIDSPSPDAKMNDDVLPIKYQTLKANKLEKQQSYDPSRKGAYRADGPVGSSQTLPRKSQFNRYFSVDSVPSSPTIPTFRINSIREERQVTRSKVDQLRSMWNAKGIIMSKVRNQDPGAD